MVVMLVAGELSRPRELTPNEADTFNKLLGTLRAKKGRNKLRRDYVDQKHRLDQMGSTIPDYIKALDFVLGWPAKAVDVPSLMIIPDGLTVSNGSSVLDDVETITESAWFRAQQKMAVDESLRSACSFSFLTPGDESVGEPSVVMSVKDATMATALKDPRSGMVQAALEVVGPSNVLMFLPGVVLDIAQDRSSWLVRAEIKQPHNMVACVPWVWGESLGRPFGKSRVTRSLMGLTDMGVRTMLRMEGHADAYSSPRNVLLGYYEEHFRDASGKKIDPLTALQNGLWALPDVFDDDTGELKRADVKQIASTSQGPHSEHLKTIALMVASETSIPVNYLGVVHDNPASAEAIGAAKADMASVVRGELPGYEHSRVQAAKLVAAILTNGDESAQKDLASLRAGFVDPERTTKSAQADAGLKFAQTFPNADPEVTMEVYGLSKDQRERMLRYAKANQATSAVQALLASKQVPAPPVNGGANS